MIYYCIHFIIIDSEVLNNIRQEINDIFRLFVEFVQFCVDRPDFFCDCPIFWANGTAKHPSLEVVSGFAFSLGQKALAH
jgi:hypothetical protein